MADWLEVSVQVDGEAAEAVSKVLNRLAYGGAVIEHLLADGVGAHDDVDRLTVKAYIPVDDRRRKHEIEEALWHLARLYPIPPPRFTPLQEIDWANAWKKNYTVLRVGRQMVIVPRWQEYDPRPEEKVITLDPGMAFGSGTHPSTRLCLVALEREITPGMDVLDLGTGSGILSIAAARCGAQSVLALDVDKVAVKVARENIATNGLEEVVRVEWGSLQRVRGTYDLILVNILAEVICTLLDDGLVSVLRDGGRVIASGIVQEREDMVQQGFSTHGLTVIERYVEKDWVALVGAKRPIQTQSGDGTAISGRDECNAGDELGDDHASLLCPP